MKTVAILLAFVALAVAQTQSDDATALQGLQTCINNNVKNIAYVNGWGVSGGLSTAGRRLQQDCSNLPSSAIPCTTYAIPGVPPGTLYTTPSAPATTTPSTPTTAGSPPGVSTTPSGVPTGTSSTSPCGDTSNPVPWTGLLCSAGSNPRVTQVIMSQLGVNIFQGNCNLSSLGGLAGLSALQTLDFTASGLSGSIPANWSTGAWSSTLQSITLAQNINVTGPIANFSGLTALASINVASSGFTGSIPLSSQGYPSLVSFVASSNDLTGTLPASLPANLTTLVVGDNSLNGTLPSYNSSTLGTFQVNNNTLSGCLPSSWPSSLTNLTTVDLSYNDLSGPIPSSWQASGAFPTLQTINIVGNTLCGSTGSLGTPVGTVGQNNPSATRLVPTPTLGACPAGASC